MNKWSRGMMMALVCVALIGATGCEKEPEREQTLAERKAEARTMVQEVLNTWEWRTWNQLLAEDVVLELKLGAIGSESAVGVQATYTGRDDAKKALQEIYGDLQRNVSVWGELAEGLQVALLADINVAAEGEDPDELPLVVHMNFNEKGQVVKMTLLSLDLRPLKAALDAASGESG